MMGRAFGAGKALASVHMELAQQEAAEDAGRVVGAAAGLVLVGVLAFASLLLVDIALVSLLMKRSNLAIGPAALAVAGGHLVLALPVALFSINKLKKPVLKRTRGRMKETAAALKGT